MSTQASGEPLAVANLYAVCENVANRASQESSRRQYASIYRRFCDVLSDELGRPPVVADLTADAIAAYARHLEHAGGRGGRPAAISTRRTHITMLRALAGELGLQAVAGAVRLPSHRAGPPETLTEAEYGNLLRVPDRRTQLGKRDYAVLRVLGDCGLRNTELRELSIRAIRQPRTNSRHHSLYVAGKGGVEREIPVPSETKTALDTWLAVHPLSRGRTGLRSDQPVFVALGRHGTTEAKALSTSALAKLIRRYAAEAGLPDRLQHPHVLRGFYATTLSLDTPAQVVQRRLGYSSLETTSRYLSERADPTDVRDA